MKINKKFIEHITIEEFADRYNLTLTIVERREPKSEEMNYYAYFEDCEVMDGCILISRTGDGDTPRAAISDYAKNISLCRIAFKATSETERREIEVPHLDLNEIPEI